VAPIAHGRILDGSSAPASGERVDVLARLGDLAVEQILSGESDEPVEFLQSSDEWLVLLEGDAVLEAEGARLELAPGDWVLLPAGTPHRLVRTGAGTSWLTVHLHHPGTR